MVKNRVWCSQVPGRGEQATRDPSDQATKPRGVQLSGAGGRRAGNQSSERPGPGAQQHPALRFWGGGGTGNLLRMTRSWNPEVQVLRYWEEE